MRRHRCHFCCRKITCHEGGAEGEAVRVLRQQVMQAAKTTHARSAQSQQQGRQPVVVRFSAHKDRGKVLTAWSLFAGARE